MIEAMILAGGKGVRMNQEIPKQFLNINDVPIIIYTLKAFQQHPEIDQILVVCIEGWQEILWAYARQFGITKLKWVITGGETGHESIRNGVYELAKHCKEDDIVLIHDAIRPNVSQEIISGCIAQCRLKGSAITVIPCMEAMLLRQKGGECSSEMIDRDCLARTQTPQAFLLKKLFWAHEEAQKRGISNATATCTLMIELGEEIWFTAGSEKNVKLTTVDDIDIFKALLYLKDKKFEC